MFVKSFPISVDFRVVESIADGAGEWKNDVYVDGVKDLIVKGWTWETMLEKILCVDPREGLLYFAHIEKSADRNCRGRGSCNSKTSFGVRAVGFAGSSYNCEGFFARIWAWVVFILYLG